MAASALGRARVRRGGKLTWLARSWLARSWSRAVLCGVPAMGPHPAMSSGCFLRPRAARELFRRRVTLPAVAKGKRAGLIAVDARASRPGGRLIPGNAWPNTAQEESAMAWIYLIVAGIFEWGWPIGLKFAWTLLVILPILGPIAFFIVSPQEEKLE